MHGRWAGVLVATVGVLAAATPTTVNWSAGNLHLTASIGRNTYAIGEVVDVTIAAQNAGGDPLPITFPSGQIFEVVVRRPRGDEVWRWSHDKAFTQAVQSRTWKPGETVTYRGAWDQRDLQGRRVDPGTYEAVAMFLGRLAGTEKRSIALPPLVITIQQ